MYELPPAQDVGFLVGKECHQLALGLYEFQIILDGTTIQVSQMLAVHFPDNSVIWVDAEKPDQSKDLFILLGRKVVEAKMDSTKTLEIAFEDQVRITIPPSSTNVESYRVTNRDVDIAA
jgi:hypothetical protein